MKQWNLFSCSHCVEPNAAHFPGCCPTSANSKKKENSKRERENDGLQRTHWREWIWTSSELPFPVLTFWRWITMCCTFCYIWELQFFLSRVWRANNHVCKSGWANSYSYSKRSFVQNRHLLTSGSVFQSRVPPAEAPALLLYACPTPSSAW